MWVFVCVGGEHGYGWQRRLNVRNIFHRCTQQKSYHFPILCNNKTSPSYIHRFYHHHNVKITKTHEICVQMFVCVCIFFIIRHVIRVNRNLQVSDSPHVDQILSQGNRICIAANRDCSISISTLALFTVRDAYHGTGNLTNFSYFRASLSNDAADQVIWHCHFMLLRVGLRSSCWAQLRASECCESCEKWRRGLVEKFSQFCTHKVHVLWLKPSILTTLKPFFFAY